MIIDDVVLNAPTITPYIQLLQHHKVYFIGVFCDLETMQEREYMRGDRCIGLANGQINRVHTHREYYDLEVDTTHKSSFILARQILQFIQEVPEPQGFCRLRTTI